MWTPTALASEARTWRGKVWRVVEAQHRISTNRLADSLADQARLEALAEAAKPDLPKAAQGLHYLLAAPFRYGHGSASRFRRAHERPGIFYASETEATAIAETAYWRLRFYTRSPGFVPPAATSEHTSFTVSVATAAAARAAGLALIRSQSARDPARGCNVVVLDPAAFASSQPAIRRTWHLRFEQGRLSALAAFPSEAHFVFTAAGFGLT